ncbi:hypothetical protein RND71_012718 [Anisodus tanguticus]|uniref:Glucan endo-1,3-beta-D-glucosidase n=1 Tax=Anisodus tanguticus TaxID=243964 RepID=A0AAE1SFU1_9SOLA|nr:hypothetical protein RND71_012718 [Anisodus tanguticus]
MLLVIFTPNAQQTARVFTGTHWINYGRIADNIPSPDKVVKLLRAAKIKNIRIYDAEPSVLNAFKGTGIELVVGFHDRLVKEMSANADHALNWVNDNVKAFLPDTCIVGIAMGNEVLGGSDNELEVALLNAVKNVYNATKKLGISDVVQILTAHSHAVFADSFPPSFCV